MRKIRVMAFPAYKNKDSNPYNYLLYSEMEKLDVEVKEFSLLAGLRLNYDIIHIHWPERYLNSNYLMKAWFFSIIFIFVLLWNRIFNKKIVWTVHNLKPHSVKYPVINYFFWPVFSKMVDGFISLSNANIELIMNDFPSLKYRKKVVTYHGLYDGIYPNVVNKKEAKAKLNLKTERKVCLFLGQLKPYKNVFSLVDMFSHNSFEDIDLVIAGKFDDFLYRKKVLDKAKGCKNINIFEGFVSEDDLQIYLNASDLMVLPFENIFNSGSALLGVSFRVPVLLPYSNNFEEYSKTCSELLVTYDSPLNKALITSALSREYDKDLKTENFSWKEIAEKTKCFYLEILNE